MHITFDLVTALPNVCRCSKARPSFRDAELQELAAYCTEPSRGLYVWWQAPEWAGKSALLSTSPCTLRPGFGWWRSSSPPGAMAEVGQHEQAAAMAAQAETLARSTIHPDWQPYALTKLAGAMAEASQHEQAETVARSITDPHWQARVLAAVAGALAGAGQHEQAKAIARSITNPNEQAQALAEVARALMARGETRQARRAASAAVPSDGGPRC